MILAAQSSWTRSRWLESVRDATRDGHFDHPSSTLARTVKTLCRASAARGAAGRSAPSAMALVS